MYFIRHIFDPLYFYKAQPMKQQFITMLTLQDKMNTKVNAAWVEQDYAWFRALWIECGELIEHHGYKWWKKQTPDVEQVKLEVIDIWHFGMSMLFDGRSIETIADDMVSELAGYQEQNLSVIDATEDLACYVLSTKTFSVTHFWDLLKASGMDENELYKRYIGKNVLNFFRQDNGYKEGSYIKIWQGREDNEHLSEVLDQLPLDNESFADLVYQALEARYAKSK